MPSAHQIYGRIILSLWDWKSLIIPPSFCKEVSYTRNTESSNIGQLNHLVHFFADFNVVILDGFSMLFSALRQGSELFSAFEAQNLSKSPTIVIRLEEENINWGIYVLNKFRCVETLLDTVWVGSLASGIGKFSLVYENFPHSCHSFLEVVVFGLIINVVLPNSRIRQNSHFSFSVGFYIISPS